jgi:hypothetical protein
MVDRGTVRDLYKGPPDLEAERLIDAAIDHPPFAAHYNQTLLAHYIEHGYCDNVARAEATIKALNG